MVIVDRVGDGERPGITSGFVEDTLTLGWEDRLRVHGRRRSDQGVEFGLSLPRGTVLKEGDRLLLEPLRRLVRVREAEEAVCVMAPENPREAAWIAYQIGNRHQPLMITGTELICPRTPGVELVLAQLGISYIADQRCFTPAIARVGHDHAEARSHRHRHD